MSQQTNEAAAGLQRSDFGKIHGCDKITVLALAYPALRDYEPSSRKNYWR